MQGATICEFKPNWVNLNVVRILCLVCPFLDRMHVMGHAVTSDRPDLPPWLRHRFGPLQLELERERTFIFPLPMTKAAPTLTEPTTTAVAQGVVLETLIDLQAEMRRHVLPCTNICKKIFRPTLTRFLSTEIFAPSEFDCYTFCHNNLWRNCSFKFESLPGTSSTFSRPLALG